MSRTVLFLAVISLTFVSLTTAEEPLRTVYDGVKDAVVTVYVEQTERYPGGFNEVTEGLGSGVLVSVEGTVLTAAHVVQAADRVEIELADGRRFAAIVRSASPRADLAALQIDDPPDDLRVAALGDSDGTGVGEDIFVVGAPYGITHTLTRGIISARRIPEEPGFGVFPTRIEVFQTDASINEGNSGGPMFDMSGRIIGIVSHIISDSGGSVGLGFAVTSNTARFFLEERRRFWSGIQGFPVAGDLAKILNVPQPSGWMIERVAANSPAERLGLRPGFFETTIQERSVLLGGDILLEIQDVPLVSGSGNLNRIQRGIQGLKPGETLSVTVLREGEKLRLSTIVPNDE